MKKFLIGIIVFVVSFVGSFFGFRAILDKLAEEEPTVEIERPEVLPEESVSLHERLSGVTGEYFLRIKGDDNEIAIAETGYTLLGAENVESITIEGVDGATIRATGEGAGRIMANGNGTLTIRNVTIIDETPHKGTYYHDYLSWGGNVVFENCEFKQSIVLRTTSATFKNCSFHSPWSKYYSVWVSHGATSFEGCLFTGYRALKIHEYEGEDITTVSVESCTFDEIAEKPGLAIGKFIADPANTTVSVKNSTFNKCQPWDTVGSIEGVDGFYEADMYTSEFNFVEENNTVDGEVVSMSALWSWELGENELLPVWIM